MLSAMIDETMRRSRWVASEVTRIIIGVINIHEDLKH